MGRNPDNLVADITLTTPPFFKPMTSNELYQGLEKILQIPAGTAREKTLLAEHSTWDSVGVMEFIVFVDEHFGLSLLPHQISESKTIGDLAKLCGNNIPD